MKRVTFLLLSLCLLALLPTASFAQKTTKRRTSSPAVPPPKPVVTDMHAEAQAVAEQLKSVSKFLYLYGKMVNGFELADDLTRRGQMTSAVAAKNKQTQQALIANIGGLRTGVDAVARNLQANPRMQVQYLKLSFAAEALASAEQLATANRFDEAGKALVTVIERLSDTILSMRLQ